MHGAGETLRNFEFALNERFVDDNLRRDVVNSLFCHTSTCFRMGSKFRCMRSTPTEMQSNQRERLRVLSKYRSKHSWDNASEFWHAVVFNFLEADFWPAELNSLFRSITSG
jgi:hypothetical protein